METLSPIDKTLHQTSAKMRFFCCATTWLPCLVALVFALPANAQNLIDNGEFDDDVDGWVANAGFLSHDDSDGSMSGPGSMSLATNSSDSQGRQCVSGILGSTSYDFGADFRVESGGPLNHCRIQLDEYDSANCSGLSTSQLASDQMLFPNNSATYTSLGSSFVSGANTSSVRVRLDCNKNFPSHTVKWDDVFLLGPEIEAKRYTLLAGQGQVLYHLPGVNGWLGDNDDVALADPTSLIGSDPNYRASFSYLAGQVPMLPNEPGLPGGLNRISFLEGTVDFQPGVGFVDSNVVQTGHRQGFGIRPWFQLGSDLSGDFLALDSPFPSTGMAYVDNVLIPKATQLGADGLLFADVTGTIPPSIWVPFAVPVRAVVFAVSGVAGLPAPAGSVDTLANGTSEADLTVTKTADITGMQPPGMTVVYTLEVENQGPAVANGIVLRDRIPYETNYLSNDCGASAPVSRIFTWAVGELAVGAKASCQVTVEIQEAANFDFHNAAIAFGNQWDSDLGSNIAEARVEVLDGASPGVDQEPDQQTGFQSDLGCDACATGAQGIADSFKVDETVELCGVTFYGGYTDNIPFADAFRVEIYDDNRQTPGVAGVPGDLVASLSGLMFRLPTGDQISGTFDEYRYGISFQIGLEPHLERGRYWLMVLNDSSSSGGTGDWFWESGDADIFERTVPGIAFNAAIVNSGLGWGPSGQQVATAFEICATASDSPIFDDGFETGDTSMWSSTAP